MGFSFHEGGRVQRFVAARASIAEFVDERLTAFGLAPRVDDDEVPRKDRVAARRGADRRRLSACRAEADVEGPGLKVLG